MSLPPPVATSTALVTGASAGIGTAIARELARRGHGVTLVARREDRLRALAAELSRDHGVRAEAIGCDLTDAAARGGLAERLQALGLDVEILVNNAGFGTGGAFHTSPVEDEVRQVRLLCEAVVALTGTFLPAMVARGRGGILNVASTAGMQPLPYSAGYAAAKAHVLALSEAIHQELRGKGVAVTALCPGPVDTEFFEVSPDHPVETAFPRFVWETPEAVARAGVDGLAANKRVVVPGLAIRAGAMVSRYSPRAIGLRVTDQLFARNTRR